MIRWLKLKSTFIFYVIEIYVLLISSAMSAMSADACQTYKWNPIDPQ